MTGKKLTGILFVFLIGTTVLRGAAVLPAVFSSLSDERDIRIAAITVSGLKRVPESVFYKRDLKLTAGKEVKIRDIRLGFERLRNCGYFSEVIFTAKKAKSGFTLHFTVKERPVLTNIKIGGDYLSNLRELEQILAKKGIRIGKIFNEVKVRQALQEYREALQNRGHFLFQIKYRAKQNLGFSEKWFRSVFRISDEKPDEPIYLKLYLLKIDSFQIDSIKVEGNIKISEETIIKQLTVHRGEMIMDNTSLLVSLWKLNRLGIFSYVFFDIRPQGLLQRAQLVIRVKEIESDIVNTSISLNSRDEFNLELDYFNYSIGENLARLSVGAVFDFKKESVNFIGMFSMPRLFRNYFFNIRFARDGLYTPIQSGWEKLTETLSLNATLGRQLSRYFSLYGSISYIYTEDSLLGSGTPPAGYSESKYHSSTGKIFMMIDSLDDNFYPTVGFRNILSVEVPLFSDLDAYILVDHKLEFYVPLQWNFTFAFYGHTAWLAGDDSRYSIQLEERRKTTAQDRLAEDLTRIGMTAFACLEFRWRFLDQFALFFFGEAAGAWGRIKDFAMRDLQYGIGLGLRIAPRQHYYAHIFKYPWSFSFGYNITSRQKDDLSYSIVSARDEYYYINLQASF